MIDLNFGCPAKTVNRSRGGAVLLKEPELLHAILCEVRRAVPSHIPVTAKMRLGYDSPDGSLDCARALAEGGAAHLVVHARTKAQGYRPPAHWEWVGRVRDSVSVPVIANGEIWTVDDWRRCREISWVDDVMLGRGLVSRPDLARQIASASRGEAILDMGWERRQARRKLAPRYAPGRLKQWLGMLTRNYAEAQALFSVLRREDDCGRIDALFAAGHEACCAGAPGPACEADGVCGGRDRMSMA